MCPGWLLREDVRTLVSMGSIYSSDKQQRSADILSRLRAGALSLQQASGPLEAIERYAHAPSGTHSGMPQSPEQEQEALLPIQRRSQDRLVRLARHALSLYPYFARQDEDAWEPSPCRRPHPATTRGTATRRRKHRSRRAHAGSPRRAAPFGPARQPGHLPRSRGGRRPPCLRPRALRAPVCVTFRGRPVYHGGRQGSNKDRDARRRRTPTAMPSWSAALAPQPCRRTMARTRTERTGMCILGTRGRPGVRPAPRGSPRRRRIGAGQLRPDAARQRRTGHERAPRASYFEDLSKLTIASASALPIGAMIFAAPQ